jgi:hypothetical protein
MQGPTYSLNEIWWKVWNYWGFRQAHSHFKRKERKGAEIALSEANPRDPKVAGRRLSYTRCRRARLVVTGYIRRVARVNNKLSLPRKLNKRFIHQIGHLTRGKPGFCLVLPEDLAASAIYQVKLKAPSFFPARQMATATRVIGTNRLQAQPSQSEHVSESSLFFRNFRVRVENHPRQEDGISVSILSERLCARNRSLRVERLVGGGQQ